ncbi:putative 2-hydroxyacid dehydrogenase [Triangularia verruculosa]|uniref:2-hydroxyacid dehydrogenase n=1 Tax=Triangularia verruculosa TaxID=2587418 RepID=A0AAN6X855_9PEZI|nr:putative 2-hydroxyacid dehydrogenase [Triangularia verruculosa]
MGSLNAAASALDKDVLLFEVPAPRDEEWISHLQNKYPGLEIRWHTSELTMAPKALPKEVYDGVTLLVGFMPHPAEMLPKVRYVQLMSAGADRWITNDLYKNPNVTFCTANGTHAPQIAEWVIGTWLMANHKFINYAEEQKKATWNRMSSLHIEDSPGLRMGILGYGAIGRHCARLGQALGMKVYAYTRSEKATPEARKDDSYVVPGTGDPDGLIPVKWFHGSSKDSVNEFLAQDLDLLVISLPLTDATRYIISKEQFEILAKKKTFVSNIARGQHINTDDLIEALNEGKIRGAALDVADPEPLTDGHPLWSAPNVFITPHVSWQTPHLFQRIKAVVERNLEGLSGKRPGLINVMNKTYGY